ncbi:MAG TPA: hypothetical protein VI540_02340 [Gaiellaceae bacterium]|nr:hypothetical protein [Gaiellaceae bacterium]
MADSYGIDPYGIEVGIVLGGGRVIEYRYDGDFVEWEDIIRQLQDEGRASG